MASFKSASSELCHSLALAAKRLSTEFVHPTIIAPLVASRLIALSKNPGVRPIGVGDTAGRIIAKHHQARHTEAAGSLQLCAGQTEAAVHAVRTLFLREET